MSKIDGKEYMILKNLKEDNCEWIFRDKSIYGRNGDLWASPGDFYKNERERRWFSLKKDVSYGVDNNLFQFIQWEDEKPYNIQELINDYEYKSGTFDWATALQKSLHDESEETEVKNIEWLKEEVWKQDVVMDKGYIYTDDLMSIINEVDEPEVLSEEWIDEHVDYADVRGDTQAFIHVEDLQNLFVATLLEIEKVQLSQKTADKLNHYKELGYSLKNFLVIASSKQAQEKLARAWLDGFTVEEQKYYARIKGHALVSDSEDGYWNVDGKELYIDNAWHDYSGYKTTILTKDEWTNLGINEDNADFIKLEELEE